MPGGFLVQTVPAAIYVSPNENEERLTVSFLPRHLHFRASTSYCTKRRKNDCYKMLLCVSWRMHDGIYPESLSIKTREPCKSEHMVEITKKKPAWFTSMDATQGRTNLAPECEVPTGNSGDTAPTTRRTVFIMYMLIRISDADNR